MKDFVTLMKYRDGDLGEEEKKRLEKLLGEDKEISEMMEFLEELDEVICEDHIEEFEEKVKKIIASYKKVKKEKNFTKFSRIQRLKKYYVAATILFFIIFCSVLFIINKSSNPDILFSKYYTSYIADIITRSSDLEMAPELNKAFLHYNNGEFPEAISCFTKLAVDEEYKTVSHFHLGMSYIELGMYQKAGVNLKEVIESEENIYTLSAKWYLSLCYIKQNKNEDAIKILRELEQIEYYSKDASKLLKSLPD